MVFKRENECIIECMDATSVKEGGREGVFIHTLLAVPVNVILICFIVFCFGLGPAWLCARTTTTTTTTTRCFL